MTLFKKAAGLLTVALMAVIMAASVPMDAGAQGSGGQGSGGTGSAPAAANDKVLLEALQGRIDGRITIPDAKAAVLIQPEGRAWREVREGPVKSVGSWIIVGMVALLVGFYAVRGKVRIDAGPSNRTIERFSAFERWVHWLTAVSFIILALTGLNLIYGRHLLIPILGPEAFTALSEAGKVAHNFLGFSFALGVVLMFVLWVAHNIPNGRDLEWLKQGGGLFKKGVHPAAGKFNAGQKLIFWAVVAGGVALFWTGLLLLYPFTFTDIAGMQQAQVIHSVVSILLTAVILAHIYIGSVGMEGAFDAMGSGQVDLNWAKEHHSLWVAEVTGQSAGGVKGGRPAAGHGD